MAFVTMCSMGLGVPTDRQLTDDDLAALVEAVRDAQLSEPETAAVEWKSSLDLSRSDVRFDIARHLLGFGNRSVERSARSFAGFAYLLIGVAPGELAGVEIPDPAPLDDAIALYVGAGHPEWESRTVSVDDRSVLILEVAPPRAGDRIATLRQEHGAARPGRVFVRRPGKTAEASPDEVRMLEERFARPVQEVRALSAARHDVEQRRLAIEQERAAREGTERAERDAPRFMPSTRSPGFALDAPAHEFSGMVVNAGGTATVIDVLLHPQHIGGAYPGGTSVVYGGGPVSAASSPVRVDHGVDLFLHFRHAVLAQLAGNSEPVTVTLRSLTDTGHEITEVLVARRQNADSFGRDLWSVRPEESRRSLRAID